MSSFLPLLRRAAPRLSRHFFPCRGCSHIAKSGVPSVVSSKISPTSAIRSKAINFRDIRYKSTRTGILAQNTPRQISRKVQTAAQDEVLLGKPAEARSTAEKGGYFPQTSRPVVAYWLFASAVSVFGIVVFGGLTRLTESGLSITEWRPVTGTLPPMSPTAWEEEFARYKASPEFKQLNSSMTLSEFKRIYWMEYTHRLWGRLVGLTCLIPTIYFIARRRVSVPIARNLILINLLIGMQGFVGWWMVKSGLKDDLFAPGAHPRVSQYRLATHLGLAFTVYTTMIWNGLQILREHQLLNRTQPQSAATLLSRLGASGSIAAFRRSTFAVAVLVCITAASGAFVAGLDAGLIYNEFPYMGLGFTPPKKELFDPFYSRTPAPHPDLWWRNMLENPSLAQLDHRILATTTFVAVNALWAFQRFSPVLRAGLTLGARRMMLGVLGLAWMQVTLGLTTLLYLVPLPLAAAHQAGSLALLTGVVVLGSRVWTTPRMTRLVKQRLEAAARQQQIAKHGKSAIPH